MILSWQSLVSSLCRRRTLNHLRIHFSFRTKNIWIKSFLSHIWSLHNPPRLTAKITSIMFSSSKSSPRFILRVSNLLTYSGISISSSVKRI